MIWSSPVRWAFPRPSSRRRSRARSTPSARGTARVANARPRTVTAITKAIEAAKVAYAGPLGRDVRAAVRKQLDDLHAQLIAIARSGSRDAARAWRRLPPRLRPPRGRGKAKPKSRP
jgi:hypothetical protein